MTDFTAYSIGTDGWWEYDDSPSEIPDIATFGWLNFGAADEIVPPSTAAGGRWGNEPMILNVVHG